MHEIPPTNALLRALAARLGALFTDPTLAWIAAYGAAEALLDSEDLDNVLAGDLGLYQIQLLRGAVLEGRPVAITPQTRRASES